MNIQQELKQDGFVLLDLPQYQAREKVLEELGPLLHKTTVTNRTGSKSLVCSTKELPLHTDHHRARYIGLYCESQSRTGGDSLLLDGLQVLSTLPEDTQSKLRQVKLMEHKVFQDDQEEHPCLRQHADGHWQLYYSYWLVKEACASDELIAINRLRKKVEEAQAITFRLKAGQLLLFDNHRMLHGRKAFHQEDQRTLIRYWIGT